MDDIKKGMDNLNTEVEQLKQDVPAMQNKVDKQCLELERQHALLQAYVTRENLVLMNVPEHRGLDGKEDTKQVFINFLQENLDIDATDMDIQRVHRVFSKKGGSRPIKVRLLRYSDKENILRNAKKLKGKEPVIFEDYPPKIRAARKVLLPQLKQARQDGKRATFSRTEPDKLIIDGNFVSCDWKKLK